ncbi:MAG: hypothetical protein K8R53_15385, partial [Bacteroidales bacterium]|nr:hypothetical protein [Bacteroidales bacterium]
MKPKSNILLLFVCSLFLIQTFGQGIINNGAFLKGSGGSYVHIGGDRDLFISSNNPNHTVFENLTIDLSGSGNYKLIINDDSYITVDGNLLLLDSLYLSASDGKISS